MLCIVPFVLSFTTSLYKPSRVLTCYQPSSSRRLAPYRKHPISFTEGTSSLTSLRSCFGSVCLCPFEPDLLGPRRLLFAHSSPWYVLFSLSPLAWPPTVFQSPRALAPHCSNESKPLLQMQPSSAMFCHEARTLLWASPGLTFPVLQVQHSQGLIGISHKSAFLAIPSSLLRIVT